MKEIESSPKKSRRIKSLRNEIIIFLFLIMIITSAVTLLIYWLIGLFFPQVKEHSFVSIIACLIASTIIGTALSVFVTKWILRPLKEMIEATEKIGKGDFRVHIHETFDHRSDFGILQKSFNHMAKELDGIEMFHNDFINNFSHEFKTPIVSLQGFAHQLQAGGLTPEEEREYIAIMVAESDRLAKMSSNILLLSKLENQQIVTNQTDFSLDEQIRTCLLLLEKQWTAKDIELDIDLDPVTYHFNEDMLSHVWLNLFGNAIKFTPSMGKVSCKLRQGEGVVKVEITDTGVGMGQTEQDHIFDKFYQADQSHNGEGNGIGLNIVGRILELCGGSVTVESREGMGSTFAVTLPVKHITAKLPANSDT